MKDFAGRHVQVLTRKHLIGLAQAVLEHVPYIANSTTVQGSAIDAFEARQGVCQDHSHIFIAMCKHLGLPSRYISGYLYAQNASHLASHAWAEVFVEQAWYCFDVSNLLFTPSACLCRGGTRLLGCCTSTWCKRRRRCGIHVFHRPGTRMLIH